MKRQRYERWASVVAGLVVGGWLSVAWTLWLTDNYALEVITTIIVIGGYLVGLALLGSTPPDREE